MRIAGVPEQYRESRWDVVRHPAVQRWTDGLDSRSPKGDGTDRALLGKGLMILGPTGTGKSSAAALCVKATVALDLTARWTYVPDLVDRMSSGPRERLHEIAMQVGVDLLVWDDFGVRDLADWEIGYLDQIVDGRYRARKPMVVTSNWRPEDFRGDQRLGRLVDRWSERTACEAVILTGASMRQR